MFKKRDILHIACLVEKVTNHIVLMWKIKFNLKQVKQKSVEVCITRSYRIFRILHIPGYKNINSLYGVMA